MPQLCWILAAVREITAFKMLGALPDLNITLTDLKPAHAGSGRVSVLLL